MQTSSRPAIVSSKHKNEEIFEEISPTVNKVFGCKLQYIAKNLEMV
jgi:hypothetical protein